MIAILHSEKQIDSKLFIPLFVCQRAFAA